MAKIKKGEVRNPYGRAGKPKTNSSGGPDANSRRMQLARMGELFGGARDLWATFGYPEGITAEDYAARYRRGDIAARIVDAYPDATWREKPEINTKAADFREAWGALDETLHLWATFHRLDTLTQLGHYGVLVLGLDGGEPMDQPARGADYKLLYLQPHGERTAEVTRWDDDPKSPRYGKPEMYRITTGVNWTGAGAGERVVAVHHSRVLHVAERPLEDVSIGQPRLERGYNRLLDLDKLLGGSAEMYWQNVAMLLAIIADPETEWDEDDKEAVATQLEDMQHKLRRALRLQGVSVQNIAPGLQGAAPGDHVGVQLDMIAGAYGVPKRILLGNEAGELASSQDENAFNGRIAERRNQFATPAVLTPFVKKGQQLGFLPPAAVKFDWPTSDSLGEQARADIAKTKTDALVAYSNSPAAQALLDFEKYVSEFLDMDPRALFDGLDHEVDGIDEGDAQVVTMFKRHKAAR